jgi:hypothetical protein
MTRTDIHRPSAIKPEEYAKAEIIPTTPAIAESSSSDTMQVNFSPVWRPGMLPMDSRDFFFVTDDHFGNYSAEGYQAMLQNATLQIMIRMIAMEQVGL